MKIFYYDIEVFPNYFLCSFKRSDGLLLSFEMSERRNDYVKLKYFIERFTKDIHVVGFNSTGYDNYILTWLYSEDREADYLDLCKSIKDYSDSVIREEWPQRNLYRLKWTDIDLYKYWSNGLRLSKKISLKGLGIQLNYPIVMELPYHHNSHLDLDMIEKVFEYNTIHDLGITELVFKVFNQEIPYNIGNLGTIGLRHSIKEFDAMSMDAPKIASETLLYEYCKITKLDKWKVNQRHKNLYIKPYVFGDYLPKIEFKTKVFQDLYTKVLTSNTFSEELILQDIHPIKISYGIGGIHSINSNEQYHSNDEYTIITSDVASLYPNLIAQFRAFHDDRILNLYLEKKVRRLEVKPNIKKTIGEEQSKWKTLDAYLKVILNGVSGLLDSAYSWLYNPAPINTLRVYGQLLLSRLTEECILNNIVVISLNTDGAELKVAKHQIDLYYSIVKQIEQEFNVEFESEEYKSIWYKSVNSYLAITKDGKVKQKGQFVTTPELGNSVDELVIAKCLNLYYVEGVKPSEVFKDPYKYGLTIYDFCLSKKISKDWKVYHETKQVQNLNRFYVSKKGGYLLKKKGVKTAQVVAGFGVTIFNNYKFEEDFSKYSINHAYYLDKINSFIWELSHKPTLF